jgi:hypothetical protein
MIKSVLIRFGNLESRVPTTLSDLRFVRPRSRSEFVLPAALSGREKIASSPPRELNKNLAVQVWADEETRSKVYRSSASLTSVLTPRDSEGGPVSLTERHK